ncbi:MAG: hypothetical protein IH624_04545 [Phycisphaerae bacterium]|nr:hypothetical protein [Phycisphaerae bacterium]
MTKTIRSVAVYFAVMIFFIMSLVGWFSGCSPATCCNRAFTGAVITYLAVSWAGRVVLKIMLDALISNRARKAAGKDST